MTKKLVSFPEKVYRATRKISCGKVSTYGMIACVTGNCLSSRAVGNALNKNFSTDIPCHRVIKSDGTIGGYRGNIPQKIIKLEREGVKIKNNQIDLKKFGWLKK
jgi:methylated-DNA-[protein]-cysteine S-methyltransferase